MQKRIPITDIHYSLCGENIEILDHVSLKCSFARVVWFGSSFEFRIGNLRDLDCNYFIESYILNPNIYLISPSLAAAILWSLWKCRNKNSFEAVKAYPSQALQMAYSMSTHWSEASLSLANKVQIEPTIPVSLEFPSLGQQLGFHYLEKGFFWDCWCLYHCQFWWGWFSSKKTTVIQIGT